MDEYACAACNMKFKSKEELDGHMDREHKKKESEPAKAPVGEKR
jgi:hypothetical protein